jgi:hypothetical protein
MRVVVSWLAGTGFLLAVALTVQACAGPTADRSEADDTGAQPTIERAQESDDRPDGPGIL